MVVFFSNKDFSKSKKGFRKWTFLKMSKIEKLKKVLKKHVFFGDCDHNALKSKKC